MLTKEHYELLYKLRDGIEVDEEAYLPLFDYLLDKKFVIWTKTIDIGFKRKLRGFVITDEGKIACDKYETNLRKEKREVDSLKVAKQSKLISWLAFGVSIAAIIASILIGIYT